MKTMVDKAVVVGAGLIGASLAGAMRSRALAATVVGVGRGRANLGTALSRGLIDQGSDDLREALADADLVILAAPVDTCRSLLADVVAAAPEQATITDTGSVKGPLVEAATTLAVADRFVGAHPMAGATASGAAAASVDLFEGATTVLTPASAASRHVSLVRALWRAVGARIVEMEASEHDHLVARVSHLPQMLSYALAASLAGGDRRQLYALAGNGLRDTTRLAGSDAAMWKAIASENKAELLDSMDALSAIWAQLRNAIENGDTKEFDRIIESARDFRHGLEAE
jgi:prephenate dehydrogenase